MFCPQNHLFKKSETETKRSSKTEAMQALSLEEKENKEYEHNIDAIVTQLTKVLSDAIADNRSNCDNGLHKNIIL